MLFFLLLHPPEKAVHPFNNTALAELFKPNRAVLPSTKYRSETIPRHGAERHINQQIDLACFLPAF